MQGQEKRRYVRIPIKRHVQLFFPSEEYDDCQVRNVSLGGMFIEGNFPQETDDECMVSLTQKARSTYIIFQAQAKVVRCDGQGLALEFTSMSFKSLLSLEMILLYEPRDDSEENEIVLPEDLPFSVTDEEESSIVDV